MGRRRVGVRSRRDGIVLIGAWIGGALLGVLLSIALIDPICC